MTYDARLRVWRGDPDGGGLQDYTVEVNEGEVVLDVIHRLQATQAPDLAVRWNCKAGKCGSCSAEVNGRPRLMCMTRMNVFAQDETVTVTPLRAFPVLRDLVTDVSFNYAKAREVPAFAPPPELAPGEFRMQQVDVERSQEFRKCIECFLCQNTCHVIRDHEENKPAYAGPRFFIRLAELDMHPLDTLDRRRQAQELHGLGMCNITKCCTEVCPEGIKITDNAIIPMKERVVDVKYDPLLGVARQVPNQSVRASTRALERGDTAAAEAAARSRLATRPGDRGALRALCEALESQGRFAEAAAVAETLLGHTRPRDANRAGALVDRAWTLLCAVEADQLCLDDVRTDVNAALAEAQRMAGSGTVLSHLQALAALLDGRTDEADRYVRETLSWNRPPQERADALLTLAGIRAAQGDDAAAADALGEAQSVWPGNPRLAAVRAKVAPRR